MELYRSGTGCCESIVVLNLRLDAIGTKKPWNHCCNITLYTRNSSSIESCFCRTINYARPYKKTTRR